MKKILGIIILVAGLASYAYSQNEVDALRYSYVIPGGTARVNAMGGSFGALGADASSLFFNPAGMGVYKSSDFSLTPSFELTNVEAQYIGRKASDFNFAANLNNLAIIRTLNFDASEDKHSSINFGFAYNRLNSFSENILIEGVNDDNSITDWFAMKGNGIYAGNLGYDDPFYSNLAYWGYLIDPVNIDSTIYASMFDRYGQTQTRMLDRSGHQGEYAFSISGNVNHKLFIGATLGIQTVNYSEIITTKEVDDDNVIDVFKSLNFREKIETKGSGANFKIGFLYSPVHWIRFGGAFHTPTILSLKDRFENVLDVVYDQVINNDFGSTSRLESPYGNYNYKIKTPAKLNASLGFIIAKSLLINADYEFVNYSRAKLRSGEYTFYEENSNIEKYYKSTHNVKLGGEYKYGPLAFRLGFAYHGSPYKSDVLNKNGHTLLYSGGVGVKLGSSTYLDLAYTYLSNSKYYGLYEGSPFAKLDKNQSRITATLGFKF
jgi:hypothetical protein